MRNVDRFQPLMTARTEIVCALQTLACVAGASFLGRMINIEDARAHEKRKRERCLLSPSRVPLARFIKANLTKETNRRLPRKLLKHQG